MKKQEITQLAKQYGWRLVWDNPEQFLLRFKRNLDDIIDVWYSTMTVGTIITHPKKGRKPLFRTYVGKDLLKQIFKNPRTHTDEGYYTR